MNLEGRALDYHQSKENTFWHTLFFVMLFALTVAVTAFLLSAVISFAIYSEAMDKSIVIDGIQSSEFLLVFASVAAIIIAFMIVIAFIKVAHIRLKGGSVIAKMLGAEPLPNDTKNNNYKRLRNVVEEMAIASGLPVPPIYIIKDESTINAFVAGYTPSDAAVTVTKGALLHLNRDELQGVIGHEFAHIKNNDMQLNTNMTTWISIIMGVYNLGWYIVRSSRSRSSSRSRGNGKIAILGLAITGIGLLGLFFGRLARSTVNRQREYFADISAVRLTRQQTGIAGALKKIAILDKNAQADKLLDNYSHMMFTNPSLNFSLTDTHPPILDRIKKIEPQFDPRELIDLKRKWEQKGPNGILEDKKSSSSREEQTQKAMAMLGAMVAGQHAIHHSMRVNKIDLSKALITNIPEKIKAAARNQFSAAPVLLSLLMERDGEYTFKLQIEAIRREYDDKMAELTREFYRSTSLLERIYRLPLAAICYPGISKLTDEQKQKLLTTIDAVIKADNNVSMYEYCLSHLLKHHLKQSMYPSESILDGKKTLSDIKPALKTLMTMLAQVDAVSPESAYQSYQIGMQYMFKEGIPIFQPDPLTPTDLDPIWPDLASLTHDEKGKLLAAMVMVIQRDGNTNQAERELLRTISSAINYPIPALSAEA